MAPAQAGPTANLTRSRAERPPGPPNPWEFVSRWRRRVLGDGVGRPMVAVLRQPFRRRHAAALGEVVLFHLAPLAHVLSSFDLRGFVRPVLGVRDDFQSDAVGIKEVDAAANAVIGRTDVVDRLRLQERLPAFDFAGGPGLPGKVIEDWIGRMGGLSRGAAGRRTRRMRPSTRPEAGRRGERRGMRPQWTARGH